MSDTRTRHRIRGTGDNTVVVCEYDGRAYGPGGGSQPVQCPYCGGNARGGDHGITCDGDEVLCEPTSMSSFRYCPGCGEEVE